MKVSKVEFGNDTVMDITDSTVTENNLLSGEIAYGSDGERVVGTVTVPTDLDDLSDVTITSPTDGQALVYDNGNWVNGDVATTDEKVKVENTPVHSATSFTRRITLAPDNDNTEITSLEKTSALRYEESNTGSSSGISAFCLGGTNYTGGIQLYRGGGTSFHAEIHPSDLTATRSVSLPDKNGTIALTNDINNNTITIKENGSTVDTFTLNQSSDKAIDIPVNQSYYGTCTDNGDVAAKTVTISNQNFKLAVGAVVSVKYTNSNTASSVTLNVNGSGNKSVWYNNAVYTSASANVLGTANRITTYIYDGTYWVWYGHGTIVDSNTHRPINVNGTQLLGNNTTAVNFKNGTNTTVIGSGADIQINATDTNTTYTFAEGSTNGKFTVTPSGGSAQSVTIHGLGSAAYTASTAYAVANKQLTNEDLDTVTDTGFYYAAGGNTCSNKPTGVNNFGLEVIRDASGSYHTQIIYKVDSTTTITSYRRYCKSGTWSSWVEDKFTDTTYTGTGLISINSSNEISTTAEKNQNAFSTVGIKVGSTTTNLAADTTTDTLTIVQGSNITLTPTANTDTFTIAATDTTYTGTGLISISDANVISTTAEVNQNAFSNIKVGSTTIAADSKTDTLTIVAGDNVTLTPDATNDKLTIAATDTTYTGTGLISVNASTHVISTTATANTGTVTSVATGAGLTGGTIQTSGTIKCDLKSESKSSLTAAARGSTSDREYPVGLDKNGDLSVNVPWTDTSGNDKVAKAGDTMTGNLKIGTSSQSSTFDAGLEVHDIRNANHTPAGPQKTLNFFFSKSDMPNTSKWWGGLFVKPWTTDYSAWELVGTAHTGDNSTVPLYVRTSNGSTSWGSWRQIYDSSNKPSKSDVGLGNVANIDQSKAIKNITRSGTTFTATCLDDTTFEFTQQDNNNYDRNRYTGTITAGAAITAKNIIVARASDGKYVHLKTNKVAFDIRYPILYANADIASGSTGNNNYDVFAIAIATTQSLTLTAYKPVYIKGTLSGCTFTTLGTAPLTQTVPSSDDGYVYMLLGIAYSTTNIYLSLDHRMFAFNSLNGFREVVPSVLDWEGPVSITTSSSSRTNISDYSDYHELYFVATLDSSNNIYATMVIPMIDIKSIQNTDRIFRSGWYQASTNGGEFDISIRAIASTGATQTWDIRAYGSARMNTAAVSSPNIKMYYR